MSIPVFVSRAEPYRAGQKRFAAALKQYLRDRGLEPRTVGDTDYAMSGMHAIRGLLMQSSGLVSVAFCRVLLHQAEDRPGPELLGRQQRVPIPPDTWLTTPWCHMETSMAYQMGLPILLLVEEGVRQEGVRQEGVFEAGVLGHYFPQFNVDVEHDDLAGFFNDDHEKWRQLVATWEGQVREVVYNRARPPRLFREC